MSASVAPGLVASRADLITYHVKDASPVDPNARKGYQERYIHSEIYKRYDQTMSVVHSHSEEVLPFGIVDGVKLRPVFHIAGFLGESLTLVFLRSLYHQPALTFVKATPVQYTRLGISMTSRQHRICWSTLSLWVVHSLQSSPLVSQPHLYRITTPS